MRIGVRCRLLPTADVPSHTSGAAMGLLRTEVEVAGQVQRQNPRVLHDRQAADGIQGGRHGADARHSTWLMLTGGGKNPTQWAMSAQAKPTTKMPGAGRLREIFRSPGVVGGCQAVSIRPVPRGDLRVKHSRKSRSTTSWVSISSWDGADFTIVPSRHPCSREIPQRTSAAFGG
jgi:hypothetical protein